MSYWGVHAGIAGVVTTLLVVRWGLPRWKRWGLIFASCAWAVFPDLHNFVPGIRPWFRPLFHQSMLANVFWFHRAIDRLDPGDSVGLSAAMWVVFLAVVVVGEYRVGRVSGGRSENRRS